MGMAKLIGSEETAFQMNRWQTAFYIGLGVAIATGILLSFPPLRPDPFGAAVMPIGLIVGVGFLTAMLLLGWVVQQLVTKNSKAFRIPLLISAVTLFGVSVSLDWLVESRWFGDFFVLFGYYVSIVCAAPVAYVLLSRSRIAQRGKLDPENMT